MIRGKTFQVQKTTQFIPVLKRYLGIVFEQSGGVSFRIINSKTLNDELTKIPILENMRMALANKSIWYPKDGKLVIEKLQDFSEGLVHKKVPGVRRVLGNVDNTSVYEVGMFDGRVTLKTDYGRVMWIEHTGN